MSHTPKPKRRLRGVITRAERGYWSAHSARVGDFNIEIGEVGAARLVQHVMLPHMIVGALVEFDFEKDSDGDLLITDVEVVGVELPTVRKTRRSVHR
jgi:hypothetical protein